MSRPDSQDTGHSSYEKTALELLCCNEKSVTWEQQPSSRDQCQYLDGNGQIVVWESRDWKLESNLFCKQHMTKQSYQVVHLAAVWELFFLTATVSMVKNEITIPPNCLDSTEILNKLIYIDNGWNALFKR